MSSTTASVTTKQPNYYQSRSQLELRSFAQKLNELEGEERPSSYLERWSRAAGKKVKVMLDNARNNVTKIGQFIGLKLVNFNCLARVNIEGNIHYYNPNKVVEMA